MNEFTNNKNTNSNMQTASCCFSFISFSNQQKESLIYSRDNSKPTNQFVTHYFNTLFFAFDKNNISCVLLLSLTLESRGGRRRRKK